MSWRRKHKFKNRDCKLINHKKAQKSLKLDFFLKRLRDFSFGRIRIREKWSISEKVYKNWLPTYPYNSFVRNHSIGLRTRIYSLIIYEDCSTIDIITVCLSPYNQFLLDVFCREKKFSYVGTQFLQLKLDVINETCAKVPV